MSSDQNVTPAATLSRLKLYGFPVSIALGHLSFQFRVESFEFLPRSTLLALHFKDSRQLFTVNTSLFTT